MLSAKQTLGAFGEEYARTHLTALGYRVRGRNIRLKAGEIDILAYEGGALVFIEVRTREVGGRFGTPEESITRVKAERLARVANEYLRTLKVLPVSWRIDIVAMDVTADGRVARIDVLKNAVGES